MVVRLIAESIMHSKAGMRGGWPFKKWRKEFEKVLSIEIPFWQERMYNRNGWFILVDTHSYIMPGLPLCCWSCCGCVRNSKIKWSTKVLHQNHCSKVKIAISFFFILSLCFHFRKINFRQSFLPKQKDVWVWTKHFQRKSTSERIVYIYKARQQTHTFTARCYSYIHCFETTISSLIIEEFLISICFSSWKRR